MIQQPDELTRYKIRQELHDYFKTEPISAELLELDPESECNITVRLSDTDINYDKIMNIVLEQLV